MSAIYDLFETPSPNKEEKQPLHARIVSKGTVDKEEFLDRVHKFTGISRSLLAGAMEAFANEARDLLADGWNVEMGNFGFFSTSLQCPPVKDKKEIRAASVQMKNINFRASRPFKKEVGCNEENLSHALRKIVSPVRRVASASTHIWKITYSSAGQIIAI